MSDVNEKMIQNRADQRLDSYLKNPAYKPYLEALEKSPLSKTRSLTSYDLYALGKQLEAFDAYRAMCEEDGTLSQLGKIPHLAFDVITANYGASPLSTIASVQPIEEEQGSVYFKDLIASSTRAGTTAGDVIFSSDSAQPNVLNGYASDEMVENAGDTAGGTLSYALTSANAPLRPQKVKVVIPALNLEAQDNGAGKLIGYDIQGTVDYATGAVTVDLRNDPAGAHPISIISSQDFEATTDLPKVVMRLRSKPIGARIWALRDTIGLEQAYAMKRRFGLVADDEVTNDLVSAINSDMMTVAVKLLAANAVGNTNFTQTAPSGVSDFEHRQSFKFRIADAESVLLANAGRGSISVMIAGSNGAALISTLPGFKAIGSGTDTFGPHIMGTLDGKVVVRVQHPSILAANTILCVHKGSSPFDAGLVWAPYMPLVITSALPTGVNPLMNQKAAAVWGGLECLVKNFVTKITLS